MGIAEQKHEFIPYPKNHYVKTSCVRCGKPKRDWVHEPKKWEPGMPKQKTEKEVRIL